MVRHFVVSEELRFTFRCEHQIPPNHGVECGGL